MKQAQKGMTLIEVAMAMLILGLAVSAMLKAINLHVKNLQKERSMHRAQGLLRTQLDALKVVARRASLTSNFAYVTQYPGIAAASVTQRATVDGQAFSWVVYPNFVVQSGSALVEEVPRSSTFTTDLLRLNAQVFWREGVQARQLTLSVLVSDFSQ